MAVGDDEALIQIRSEGGFAPVEAVINNGPRYTILGDGTVIFPGVIPLLYPGPLVHPYMKASLSGSQLDSIIAMIDRMGLPEMGSEHDDSATQFVADATTEVITFWDEAGKHTYSVYALGIQDDPVPATEAFKELVETLDRFTAETEAEPYQPESYRVVAGETFVDPEFEDVRPWPLTGETPEDWESLPNGWTCTTITASEAEAFTDASQATTWENPDGEGDPVYLLVRPLFAGEGACG